MISSGYLDVRFFFPKWRIVVFVVDHSIQKDVRIDFIENRVGEKVAFSSIGKSKHIVFFLTIFFLIGCFNLYSQHFIPQCNNTERIIFYNLENLFDTKKDEGKNDDEFLPNGVRNWTNSRFYSKLKRLYKVFMACGTPEPPVVIAICEVENEFAVRKLIETTPLKSFGYRYVHYESPDMRGVDCGLLYREDRFELFDSRPYQIVFPFDTASKTRDILYVKGLLFGKEMIHIFVNHWPSRYGGQAATMPKRNYAAQYLRAVCDSILLDNPSANILIMGDMNDDPIDESVTQYLCGKKSEEDSLFLSNLTLPLFQAGKGTLKHGAFWSLFDQIIVSPATLNGNNGLKICKEALIFDHEFLFVEDETNMGKKLFRTYNGMSYSGGYSDHLPVGVDIQIVDK
jgi:hypothetical protein